MNTEFMAEWKIIQSNKQRLIAKNNKPKNMKQIKYDYQVNQKVLIEKNQPNKLSTYYEGPYKIIEVQSNGTVILRKPSRGGAVLEKINIQRLL